MEALSGCLHGFRGDLSLVLGLVLKNDVLELGEDLRVLLDLVVELGAVDFKFLHV